ncbi:MAG: D-sedoheptulose 7-phosphate isomerase [Desulfobacteraceae bacterium]|nr:D-sedoheptulose 7-phosphate isomerase [Desulfobacteraceae bacterium]
MRKFRDIVHEHNQVLETAIEPFEQNFIPARDLCLRALQNGKKLLVCGNGGSAADAQHFAAELVGRYEKERKGWPALALSTDTSVISAIANDYGFEQIFARQVQALGHQGDVLIAISTSGNSPNVLQAANTARQHGMKIIAFTGEGGGRLGALVDVLFAVPSKHTARVQEIHEICLHALAETIETELSKQQKGRENK